MTPDRLPAPPDDGPGAVAPRAARLDVLGSALLFSFGSAAIKGTTLEPWQVACARSLVAALALWLLFPAARRLFAWRPAVVGVAYAGALVCYALANKLTTAASTIFLQSTTPLYVLVLAPLLLGERLRRRDLLFMAAVLVGLGLVFIELDPVQPTAPRPLLGNVLAVGSGAFFGTAIVGMRWLGRDGGGGAMASVVWGNLLAAGIALGPSLPVLSVAPRDVVLVLFLGVFQIGLAYRLLTRGLERVPAFEASLLLLVEPVINPFWAWLFHGERFGGWTVAGGLVIVGATAAKVAAEAALDRRRLTRPRPGDPPGSDGRGASGDRSSPGS